MSTMKRGSSDTKSFPIFNRNAERERVLNKNRRVNKISDHFKPKPKRPNDPKDEDKRGPGN